MKLKGKKILLNMGLLVLILSGSALLTYILVTTVQLQLKIIPEEERKSASYIQRTAHRKKEMAIRNHFHKIVEEQASVIENESVCFLCHTTLPHHKHKKIRALMNMHTFFMTCETCHIKNEDNKDLQYQWLDPPGTDLSLGHYGTSYHPLSGSLLRVNLQSRITPFEEKNGERKFLIENKDSPLAQDYLRVKDTLSEQEKDFVKKNFHKNIKPVGYDCKECHRAKGKLDLEGLGFSEKRRLDLENLSVSGMMTRYETFYLPELFEK